MATYGYEAINKAGKTVKGSVEADSIEKARADLKNRGMSILSLEQQNALTKDLNIEFGGKPTTRDLSVFCRQFVSMFRAGVTIIDSLKMLAEATENKKLKEAITGVRIAVEKGQPFARALQEYPKVFPSLMVNMVDAGEASGSLDISMERMATQFERSSKTTSLVKKAMIYPIVVCIVAIAVVIVMLLFVIPNYVEMFKDLGTELPWITVMVMNASEFVQKNWIILFVVIAVLAFAFNKFRASDFGKHFLGKLAIKIPMIANLVVKNATAQLSRTLSTLMSSGVPLVESVAIVANTMSNVWFKEAMIRTKEQIESGRTLSDPIKECGLFPSMACHMIRIGEETGNTEDMLDKLADYYEEEVEVAVSGLMSAMEPMIIIVLAGIVGVILAACMMPMMTMYDSLGGLM